MLVLWLLLWFRYLRSGGIYCMKSKSDVEALRDSDEVEEEEEASSADISGDNSADHHPAIDDNIEEEVELYRATAHNKRSRGNVSERVSQKEEEAGEEEEVGRRGEVEEPLDWAQKVVIVVFALLVLAWFTRSPQGMPGWSGILVEPSYPSDGTAAMAAALLLFLAPNRNPFSVGPVDGTRREAIIGWKVMNELPWDVIFLLGGGERFCSHRKSRVLK